MPDDAPRVAIGGTLASMGVPLAMLAPVVLFVAYLAATDPGPGWYAEYFTRPDFTGDSIRRIERGPYVRIYRDAPAPGVPKNGYSVRWRSCLVLPRAATIVFQLTSGDGSRLFVDDSLVVDNWGEHPPQARAEKLALAPGTHPLRLEHFRKRAHSVLGFNVSLDGGPIQKLPPEWLALPTDEEGRCLDP